MDWQPIATAPRDGTRILIAIDDRIYHVVWDGNSWKDLNGAPYPNNYGLRDDRDARWAMPNLPEAVVQTTADKERITTEVLNSYRDRAGSISRAHAQLAAKDIRAKTDEYVSIGYRIEDDTIVVHVGKEKFYVKAKQ